MSDTNKQVSTQSSSTPHKPLCIWVVTDNKPGHLNQLKGLCERIAAHEEIIEHWVPVSESKTQWLDYVLGRYKASEDESDLLRPDLVIGAGHRTHKDVLAIKRAFNCFSVVLMKPSLPVKSFNAAIIPEHDSPTTRDNTLITKGVLNTLEPITPAKLNINKNRGLILLGGESKHYYWDTKEVVSQTLQLVDSHPDTQWILSDSRRTPADLINLMTEHPAKNLEIIPHAKTQPGWVKSQMMQSSTIWVTPDSVSMVYESITSGVPTGIFRMRPKKRGRIVKGIIQLIDENWVTEFTEGAVTNKTQPMKRTLWESERAAIWLLGRYNTYMDNDSDNQPSA